MRFVVDSMLGTLARKLRIFGFDSLYYNDIDDDKLLSIVLSSDRVLLTSDKELFKRVISKNGRCILVNSNDEDNLVKILSYLGLKLKFVLDHSRCPLCNEPLKRYDKIHLKELIPKKVYDTNDEFYLCSRCKKVYWKGSHIKRLLELEKRVNEKIVNS